MDSTNLTLHIKADAAGLKQVTDVLKRMELAAGSASALSSSMSKLQLDMAGLQKASSITRGQMAGLAAAAEKEKKSLNTLSGEVARLSKSNKTLTKTVDGSTKKLKAQEKAAGKTSKSMKDLDAFTRGAAGGAGKLWLSYGNLIPMITGFASAMGVIKFTDMTTSFQYEMATIQALGSYTNKELDKLKDQLLSIRSIKGPAELVSGLKMLTKSGLDATEAIAGVKDVALLAELGSLSLSDSAKIATRSLRIFGLEEEKLGYVANILAYTASNANMEVSDLGAAMAYTTELSTLLGFGLEETSAAMMILHDKGIAASMAGTSLRTSMVRLAAPTGKTAEYMERLGISVTKPGGGQKDLEGVIGGISKAMQGLSETARTDAFRQLFGLRAQKAPIALVQAFEEGTLQSALEELRSKGAESLSIYEQIIGEKARGKWKLLAAEIEKVVQQFAIEIDFDAWLGDNIKTVHEALDAFIIAVKQFQAWKEAHKTAEDLRNVPDPITGTSFRSMADFAANLNSSVVTLAKGAAKGYAKYEEYTNKTVDSAIAAVKHLVGGGNFDREMVGVMAAAADKVDASYRAVEAKISSISAPNIVDFSIDSAGGFFTGPTSEDNEGTLPPAIKSRIAAQKKITKSLKAELAIRSNLTQQFYRFQQFTEEEYTQQSRELKNEALEVERSDIITRRSFYLESLESDYI
ncbi:MAG: phage tail tape measure protein, partial [Candidatus Hydrothermarchaeota archaeon]